jgi:two-component system sensor histidine kinase VicK
MESERTEVLYGNENIQRVTIEAFSHTKERMDACLDHTEIAMHVQYPLIFDGIVKLRDLGVKLRIVTEVTHENIFYCKKLIQFIEIRHLDGIRSNVGIADKRECLIHVISRHQEPLSHAIISNSKGMVEAQQYLFDTLWKRAIPAELKIREIEEGVIPDFIETKSDPNEILKLEAELLKSAKEEVVIIFPTASILHYYDEYEEGDTAGSLTNLLSQLPTTYPGIQIKIITPLDHRIEYIAQNLKSQHPNNMFIQYSVQPLENTVLVLVIDRKFSLSAEIKEKEGQKEQSHSDSRISPGSIIGLATYSNSKATVLSHASIFESLWKQAELYEDLKISKVMLSNTENELENMKNYMNEVLREVGRVKNKSRQSIRK